VKITHKWLFQLTPRAQRALDKLPSTEAKMGVFAALEQVLKADNPTTTKDTSQLQSESGEKVWRKHADGYRIFFVVYATDITINNRRYKGTVWVTDIRKKEKKTYR
jgi:mRNA-degrading endonuclease RelE of RelBE toxin-antitoxin system